MEKYLEETKIIDWKYPTIQALAKELAEGCKSNIEIAKSCFEWVRDNIKHSWDYQLNPVTCKASDVLLYKTGYCYAKSHLLGALLRANDIPTGFCYQRIRLEGKGTPYCLHGLNAVFLPEYGWYRIDARGNKEGVDAQFTPPIEQLAFSTNDKREANLLEIWPSPLQIVIDVLENSSTFIEVYENLPDVELLQTI
ncbi:MAG: transglutaminase family protein [bacterium]